MSEDYVEIINQELDELVGKCETEWYTTKYTIPTVKNDENSIEIRVFTSSILEYKFEGDAFLLRPYRYINYVDQSRLRDRDLIRVKDRETFRNMVRQDIQNYLIPYIFECYKSNSIKTLPDKLKAPEIKNDISKITKKWLEKAFKSNGETIYKFNTWENDGKSLSAEFMVDCGRRGIHSHNSVTINNRGAISVSLCEVLEGVGIEENIEEAIEKYIRGE